MSYQELVDRYMIDAFEYMERIVDFIDKEYGTTYYKGDMGDEIEQSCREIKNKFDFETVELTYDLACEKYPLMKVNIILNPRFHLINSYHVFKNSFDDLFEYLNHRYEDKQFYKMHNEAIQRLIELFPSCEKTIQLQMKLKYMHDFNDDVWLIPREEIESEEYRNLYVYVQTFRP